jgi:hypothetical protein
MLPLHFIQPLYSYFVDVTFIFPFQLYLPVPQAEKWFFHLCKNNIFSSVFVPKRLIHCKNILSLNVNKKNKYFFWSEISILQYLEA